MRLIFSWVLLGLFLGGAAGASTLETVKARGTLICGVGGKVPGFSTVDADGKFLGLDVDYCRAVAAAIFGDAAKVKFTPVGITERFTALQSGEIDILARNTTWSFSRDTGLGIEFVGTLFYDGLGFMVHKSLKAASVKELDGASICIQSGTTTEQNIADYFTSNHMKYEQVLFESADQATKIYESGRCDAYATDSSSLAARRAILADPAANVILPEIISKEPLGPAVRAGDTQFAEIARWVLFALIDAEELNITSANADEMRQSVSPGIKRFLGGDSSLGSDKFGLGLDWAYQVIKQVGNYGEIFDRNLGAQSAMPLPRGINELWIKGGILYAPPVR